MIIESKDYRVPPDKKVDLSEWPTIVAPYCKSKKQYKEVLQQHMEKLSALQQLHYASNRYALLLIFQGTDSAGKDGAIRHVMSGVNPEGCEVFSFKQPSAEELEHDFLWRTTCRLPERGRIGIFNRSYYEEVLVVRVHPEILRSQGLPKELRDEKNIWEQRYGSIVDLEKHLHRNGTRIVKIFGSAQESVKPPDFRGFCLTGRIGYSLSDARQRLDTGIRLAGLQGLPA